MTTTTREIKTALRAKLDGLMRSCQSGRDEIAIQRNPEEMDEIQQGELRVLALDSLMRKHEMAGLVSQALERLDDGTYGICGECEEEIAPRRLAAIPWARYCIACQEMRDSFTPGLAGTVPPDRMTGRRHV